MLAKVHTSSGDFVSQLAETERGIIASEKLKRFRHFPNCYNIVRSQNTEGQIPSAGWCVRRPGTRHRAIVPALKRHFLYSEDF